jgi:branched-chain amino acid transport system permease protein
MTGSVERPATATSRWPAGSALVHAGKDAGVAGLISLMLALPLMGVQTIDTSAGLALVLRLDRVAIGVGIVLVGRFLLRLWWDLWAQRRPAAPAAARPTNVAAARGRWLVAIGIAALVALPFLPFASRYTIDLATTVLIYVMLGWGLNIVVGLAGLLDLGYVAFYAVGAYSFALLAHHAGFSFWAALPLAGGCAALFGILLGFPVLRLRGDYLAIVTLGFGEIVRIVLINLPDITGGPNGIAGIPRPSFFGIPFTRPMPGGELTFAGLFGLEFSAEHRVVFLYFVILTLALATNLFAMRLRRLPIGRAWEALREDEIACRALGINPTNTKLTAFAIGAMFGGFAGCFFAARQGFISPESFTFMESATILAIVVLGGMGSQFGIVMAALVLVVLPEIGRDFAEYRMLLFGAAMVAIMVWRPRGLMAHRTPSVRLGAATRAGAG